MKTHQINGRQPGSLRIYISGKISGEPLAQCTMKFGNAENTLRLLGHEPVNPLAHQVGLKKTWLGFMRTDIKLLMDCDALYALPCYEKSKGALLEYRLCIALGIPVYTSMKEVKKATKLKIIKP